MTQVMTSTRPEATAKRGTSGAPIVHDVTSLFVTHAETCTVCPRQTEPCRDGNTIIIGFINTSTGYFRQYTA